MSGTVETVVSRYTGISGIYNAMVPRGFVFNKRMIPEMNLKLNNRGMEGKTRGPMTETWFRSGDLRKAC